MKTYTVCGVALAANLYLAVCPVYAQDLPSDLQVDQDRCVGHSQHKRGVGLVWDDGFEWCAPVLDRVRQYRANQIDESAVREQMRRRQ